MKRILCIILSTLLMATLCACGSDEDEKVKILSGDTSIVFFKTNNDADSALIKLDGANILIDAGEKKDAKSIIKFLNANNITRLDLIIFSHFDKDHCGGASKLLDEIEVSEIVHGAYIKDSGETKKLFEKVAEKGIKNTTIDADTSLEYGELSLKLMPAKRTSYAEKESNNSSMVVMAEIYGKRAFFTGDCEEERIKELLDTNEDYSADILKLMYHGREVENESKLIERINPSYTIITAKSKDKEVKNNAESLKLVRVLYSTDDTVIFNITQDNITVEQ